MTPQSGRENGEFVIVEPFDEQFRYTATVDWGRYDHTFDTDVGQRDDHAAPVLRGVGST